MRPVEKWKPGEEGTLTDYNPYGTAKDQLVNNLGDYCSYCDRFMSQISLEVEHIKPKGLAHYTDLKFKWDNFLLACKNCNLAKGDQDFDFREVVFPHLDNSWRAFEVHAGGKIMVNSNLDNDQKKRAEEAIRLFGLQREPGMPSHTPADDRHTYRRQTWIVATKYLSEYEAGNVNVETIIDLAKPRGFWMVWMKVFKDHPKVQVALAEVFPGTYSGWNNPNVIR